MFSYTIEYLYIKMYYKKRGKYMLTKMRKNIVGVHTHTHTHTHTHNII